MNRRLRSFSLVILLVIFGRGVFSQDSYKPHDFDQADEADDLNRELWEFARKTPFDGILPYIEREQSRLLKLNCRMAGASHPRADRLKWADFRTRL